MIRKTIIPLLALCLCILPLFTAAGEETGRIVICDFSLVAPTTDQDYYTFIIPDGLQRHVEQNGTRPSLRVNRQLHPGLQADSPAVSGDRERFRQAAAELDAEWLVTGTVVLTAPPAPPREKKEQPRRRKGKKQEDTPPQQATGTMTLILLVYDRTLDRTEVVATEPFRQEALVQKAIDMVGTEAMRQIGLMEQEKLLARQRAEAEEAARRAEPGESPWTGPAGIMSMLSGGIDCGIFMFTSSWRDLYNDTQYVSPWMGVSLNRVVRGLGLAGSMSYVASDMTNPPASSSGMFQVWTGSLGVTYTWQPLGWLSLQAAGGAGAAWTRMGIYPNSSTMPFVSATTNEKSVDPFIDLSGCVRFSFKPVHLRTGVTYRRIFYTGEDLGGLCFFAGVELGM